MKQMILAELSAFMEADECQVELWDRVLIEYLAEDHTAMRSFRFGTYHDRSRVWHACLLRVNRD